MPIPANQAIPPPRHPTGLIPLWGPEQPRSGQKNKEKKETLKEVLTPFAHRPFQSITHPSLTLRELPIPSGALSYLLKVGLRGAP